MVVARASGVSPLSVGSPTGACAVAEASCTHTLTVLGGPGQAAKAEAKWGHTGSLRALAVCKHYCGH